MQPDQNETIFRITALWAFAECALGGIMHALKIPFTGIFVGGFAVLSIALLAHAGKRKAGIILRATLLVILVKAIVSPQSPLQSYIAVAFQGLSGALILCYLRLGVFAPFIFGFIAMIESAFQKLLFLLLFFGKSLFEAVDLFVADILETFQIHSTISWSYALVGLYIGLYSIWGLVLGYWIRQLPGQLDSRAALYAGLELQNTETEAQAGRKNPYRKWLLAFGVFLFIVTVFAFAGGKSAGFQKALFLFVRTLAVLLAWFFIAYPLVKWLFSRWIARKQAAEKGNLQQLLDFIPDLRSKAGPLYRYVAERYSGWRRIREFVLALFITAIHMNR